MVAVVEMKKNHTATVHQGVMLEVLVSKRG